MLLLAVLFGCSRPGPPPPQRVNAAPATPWPTRAVPPGIDPGTVTVGSASQIQLSPLTSACTSRRRTNFNPAVQGVVTAADGSQWTVPAEVAAGPTAPDLYNDCTAEGENAAALAGQIETVVVDPDGEEITGYLFADNYFELYVNGTLVGRDPIGFTPFNASVVRFKARYPITYAVKLVDWETHPGIGMEYDRYQIGDGGFIAWFSDGTVTGPHWKVAPFYIAPLDDPACVDVEHGRDSSGCPPRPACTTDHPDATCRALHFRAPADWTSPTFDDASWSAASVFRAAEVTDQPAYTRYTALFGSASFIWSRNLLLDNLVLARLRVDAPRRP